MKWSTQQAITGNRISIIIPKEKLIQTKAETFTVEGYNSLFRHFLAGMRRTTKCHYKTKC
jgi:IS1 family transposase